MTEQADTTLEIQKNEPGSATHPLANQETLSRVNEMMEGKNDIVSMATYFREIAGKPRGIEGGQKDLNSHFEEFVIRYW